MPAVTLRHPSQAAPAEASLWLGWCGDSFAPRTPPSPFVHPTSPRGHLWQSPLSFPSWACKAPCPGLLGLGNERQGLKPALVPLLGSRACPSHREAVRRARRPPAFPHCKGFHSTLIPPPGDILSWMPGLKLGLNLSIPKLHQSQDVLGLEESIYTPRTRKQAPFRRFEELFSGWILRMLFQRARM